AAVEVGVGTVGPDDVGRSAGIGLHLDKVDEAAVSAGRTGDPELADLTVVVGVLRHLGGSESRFLVWLALAHRVQRLRHVDVPRRVDEAGAAGLGRAGAERGRAVPDDVDTAGRSRRDPRN